jgi:hypothetical protein
MNELQHCMNVNYEYRPFMDHYRKTIGNLNRKDSSKHRNDSFEVRQGPRSNTIGWMINNMSAVRKSLC